MASTRVIKDWVIHETLGKGGFSKVKLGTNVHTGEKVALKLLSKEMDETSRRNVERELGALERLKHRNIIRLLGHEMYATYPKKNGYQDNKVILVVLEYGSGGEVFEFLSRTGNFEEAIARAYFHQLVDGLEYCHSVGVVHRDLKPENLLLDENFVLKIADFGFASVEAGRQMSTQCGTPGYMAPEMFIGSAYDATKTDIWACGVILFIMLAGFPPFQKPNISDWWFHKLKTGRHDLFWKAHSRTVAFSESAKDLINKVLCPDPDRRITLDDIKRHEWFNQTLIPESVLIAQFQQRQAVVHEVKAREDRVNRAKKHGASEQTDDNAHATYKAMAEFDPESETLPPAMEFFTDVPKGGKMEFEATDEDYSEGKADDVETVRPVCYTKFQSRAPPHELYARLLAVVIDAGAQYTANDKRFKIKADVVTAEWSAVKLGIQIFQSKTGVQHVEFKRLSGDGAGFRAVYFSIRDKFADLVLP